MEFIKFIVALSVIIFITVLGVNSFYKWQTRSACAVFSQESGRETKYVEYTYWYVDCLTPQEGGWISAYNLVGVK